MRVEVKMAPVRQIIAAHGLDKNGDVQRYWTELVNRRMTRYMPFRTGALATKLKYVASPTEIVVLAPYAKYQYYGKVMVNAKTGRGPMNIPGVGLRYKKGTVLKPTSRPLNYDRSKNPLAGPYWDRAMIAAEGSAMTAEMQRYINTRGNAK